jgi:hypothetical protein
MNDLIGGIIYNQQDPVQQASEQLCVNQIQQQRNALQNISNESMLYHQQLLAQQNVSVQNLQDCTIVRNQNSDSFYISYKKPIEVIKNPINWKKYFKIILLFLPVLSLLTLWLL